MMLHFACLDVTSNFRVSLLDLTVIALQILTSDKVVIKPALVEFFSSSAMKISFLYIYLEFRKIVLMSFSLI